MCEPGPTLTVNTAVDSGDMRYEAALGVGSAVSMSQYIQHRLHAASVADSASAHCTNSSTTRVSNYRPIRCAHSLRQPFTGL